MVDRLAENQDNMGKTPFRLIYSDSRHRVRPDAGAQAAAVVCHAGHESREDHFLRLDSSNCYGV